MYIRGAFTWAKLALLEIILQAFGPKGMCHEGECSKKCIVSKEIPKVNLPHCFTSHAKKKYGIIEKKDLWQNFFGEKKKTLN